MTDVNKMAYPIAKDHWQDKFVIHTLKEVIQKIYGVFEKIHIGRVVR
jgi:hypothetical protein